MNRFISDVSDDQRIEHATTLSYVLGKNGEGLSTSQQIAHSCIHGANSEVVGENLLEGKIKEQKKANSNKTKVFCSVSLNESERRKLIDAFPEFLLSFESASCSLHCFAAETRNLMLRHCVNIMGISQTSKPTDFDNKYTKKNYDAVLKDVGANPDFWISNFYSNVHLCCPVIDGRDDSRLASVYTKHISRRARFLDLKRSNLNKKKSEDLQKKLTNLEKKVQLGEMYFSSSRYRCSELSQHCAVRSPFLLFTHSSYDMTMLEIVTAMDTADATSAYGFFHFSPIVLTSSSGTLPNAKMNFQKFISRGKEFIRFYFENDTQLAYIHNFKTYLDILKTTTKYTNDGTVCYKVEIQFFDELDILQFNINRAVSSYHGQRKETIFRPLTMIGDKYTVIYSWMYSTVPSTSKCLLIKSDQAHLYPVRLVCPRRFFNDLLSYAMMLPSGKFTVENLYVAACHFNNKEVINGVSITERADRLDPKTCYEITAAVYMIAYVHIFETTKAMSLIKKDQESVREYYRKDTISRLCSSALWSNIASNLFGFKRDDLDFKLLENKNHHKSGYFDNLLTVREKFPLIFSDSVRAMNLAEEVYLYDTAHRDGKNL